MEEIIKRFRNTSWLRNCKLLAPIVFLLYYPARKKYALETVATFCGNDIPEKEKRRLVRKMVWNKVVYHIDFPEYFLFDVPHLSRSGKQSFIGCEDNTPWADKMNKSENRKIFDNKMQTYNRFREFYGRDVCMVTDEADGYEKFAGFICKHPRFIAKPANSYAGVGVALFDLKDYSSGEELYSILMKKYKNTVLLEEPIIQVEELAEFHPASVNTVRMPTFRFDDRTEIKHPFWRMGQKGNVADNAGAGGIFALIDIETGIVFSAVDERGNSYVCHPDTGLQIIGYKIPRWEEAKEFAKKLAQVIPDNRYTGWDIALTSNGWIMVEGNACAQFVHQIPLHKGCREEIEEIIAEMNI